MTYLEEERIGWNLFSNSGVSLGKIEVAQNGFFSKINDEPIRDSKYRIIYSNTLMGARKIILDHADIKKNQPSGKMKSNIRFLPETDHQFYPTPSWIAGKMIGKIKWNGVNSILEPSAGKGDLVEALLNAESHPLRCYRMSYANHKRVNLESVDAIEIDKDLRHILSDKNIRVLGDNFLTFSSAKQYDLIIMNPPFLEGASHLIKAIHMLRRGGQVVCLLNAETITNPFSRERQQLLAYLKKYDARIEYIDHGFKKAERKAKVRLAIVSMTIPSPKPRESEIWNKIKKAKDREFASKVKTGELVTGSFIDQAVLLYQTEANAAYAFFQEFNALSSNLRSSFEKGEKDSLIGLSIDNNTIHDRVDSTHWQNFVELLRMKYWKSLFERPEITRLMTSSVSNTYYRRINELKDYEFSKFNILQIMEDLSVTMRSSVESSIETLFDDLTAKHSWFEESSKNIHYYSGWATNQAHKIGMKAILPVNGYSAYSKDLDLYYISRVISDLERALSYLDYGTTLELNPKYDIGKQIRVASDAHANTIYFTYFTATFYKKGTCHIKFHPRAEKLIDRLNIYVGQKRNWLPPCYGKKHYSEMTDEEKNVINSFQGAEAYEQVISSPEDYITENKTPSLLLTVA